MTSLPVHIVGDKSLFSSKNAVSRLKDDVRNGTLQESTSYLKENCDFRIVDQTEKEVKVEVFLKEEMDVKEEKDVKEYNKEKKDNAKRKLASRINSMREMRQSESTISSQLSKKLGDNKDQVPRSLLEEYARLKN